MEALIEVEGKATLAEQEEDQARAFNPHHNDCQRAHAKHRAEQLANALAAQAADQKANGFEAIKARLGEVE